MTGLLKGMLCRLTSKTDPDPHVWLFSSTDNRHFNYNSKYLFEYVRLHCPDIHPLFVINDDALRRRLERRYGREYFIETKTTAGIRMALMAGVWFTSAGLPVYGLHLAKGRRIINLWHGVPLKRIALRDLSGSRISRLYFRQIFSHNYTDVVTTSEAVGCVMAKSLGVSESVIRIWGQPRCDCLYRDMDTDAFLKRLYPDLPMVSRTVLYAPTFRKGKAVRLFPFADFDREELDAFLEREKILLCIRMHISETDAQPLRPSLYVRYLNEDLLEDIMEGLQAFDVLVTDYSSLYIDYLLLNRPVVFLPYDLKEYSRAHGFSFPYEKVTPGAKPRTMKQFLEAISAEDAEDPYEKQRRRVRHLFYARGGPCCARICKEVRKYTDG